MRDIDVFRSQVNFMSKGGHQWPQEISREVLAALAPADQRALLERANLRVI